MAIKPSIAIDGPSGVGKGITTELVAKKLNYKPLDTGAIYRAIGYYMLKQSITPEKFKPEYLNDIKIEFSEHNFIQLNGEPIEEKIRNLEIGMAASNFGKIKEVRAFSTKIQKQLVLGGGYIVDGRASAYEIPEIPIKIYMDADSKIRAQRRYEELKKSDPTTKFNEVHEQLIQRDEQDQKRSTFPLQKHKDSILVDNSNLTIGQQVELILDIYNNYVENQNKNQPTN